MARMTIETWSTGPKKLGGHEYTELRVRDQRGKIVAYALCETDVEIQLAGSEFRKDFDV